MGALHEGHLSLVRRARAENASVLASIFVNPTQFGPHEDFSRYPRDLEADCRLLETAGCDAVFAPTTRDIYPEGFGTSIDVGLVARPLEGKRRPGHFAGVATVVARLLLLVRPERAYFGEKDAQQLAVIRRLVTDLALPVEIVGCPIVREPDGLAMSSRNAYLDPQQRKAASVLFSSLEAAAALWAAGRQGVGDLEAALLSVLQSEPLAKVDYASAVDPLTFERPTHDTGDILLALAAWIGTTRLIDNQRLLR
jgi:pantoate--beta-alanine ligase